MLATVPSVFVSSTCYDLRQVRADLREFFAALGFDPVLSEFSSFPVDPAAGTVENSVAVVENKADLFVLIVGARYGSLTDQGKSVTNLEFLTAKAKGIPVYVFVLRSVLDILPVWKANQAGDFSGVVDSPQVFEFVASMRDNRETWVYPFENAQDITTTLRTQLAYLFKDALDLRSRANCSGLSESPLRELRGSALRLVIERPAAWEYLLFGEVLQAEIRRHADLRRDSQYGLCLGPARFLKAREFMEWVRGKLAEAQAMTAAAMTVVKEVLPAAFGPQGAPGDAEAIMYAAKRIADIYRAGLEWKLDFPRVVVPNEFQRLRLLAACLCDNFPSEIEEFCRTFREAVPRAIAAQRSGDAAKVHVVLKLSYPDLTECNAEAARLAVLIASGRFSQE